MDATTSVHIALYPMSGEKEAPSEHIIEEITALVNDGVIEVMLLARMLTLMAKILETLPLILPNY